VTVNQLARHDGVDVPVTATVTAFRFTGWLDELVMVNSTGSDPPGDKGFVSGVMLMLSAWVVAAPSGALADWDPVACAKK